MNKVKWLWSITTGVGLVLIYASLSAYFVDTGEFYASLNLPDFALSPLWITVGWSVVYLVDIAVISRLVYYKSASYLIIPLMILGILNVFWCMVFFVFCKIVLSFVLLIFMTVLVLVVGGFLIKEDGFSLIFWQIKIVWYIYLCTVSYFIVFLNA